MSMFNETCYQTVPAARTEGLGCGCDPQPVVVLENTAQQSGGELPGWVKWAAIGVAALLLLKR
jgi:hypothetical protein